MSFLVKATSKMNVDTITHVQTCSISCLLKALLLTSEHDTNDFHTYNSKEIFEKS